MVSRKIQKGYRSAIGSHNVAFVIFALRLPNLMSSAGVYEAIQKLYLIPIMMTPSFMFPFCSIKTGDSKICPPSRQCELLASLLIGIYSLKIGRCVDQGSLWFVWGYELDLLLFTYCYPSVDGWGHISVAGVRSSPTLSACCTVQDGIDLTLL